MFEIVEWLCVGKNGHPNSGDDRLFQDKEIVAVLDGVTSDVVCPCCSIHAGSLASDALVSCLAELDAESDLSTFLRSSQQALIDASVEHSISPSALQVSIAVWNNARGEIWIVGDCQAYFSGTTVRNVKKIDTAASIVRSTVLWAQIQAGASIEQLRASDIGREALRPLLNSQSALANSLNAGDLAYGVLSTVRTPIELCRVIEVVDPRGDIILATDGYPEIFDSLAATELNLERLLSQDPLCIGPLRSTKGILPGNESFDDRAYVRIRRAGSPVRNSTTGS